MAQPGFFAALWCALVRFLARLFHTSPNPSPLPTPATAQAPSSALLRLTRQRRHPKRAVASPVASARTTSASPQHIFHPPASPLPTISLSGIFASPPLFASSCLASEIEIGRLALASPSDHVPSFSPPPSPRTPSPLRSSHALSSPSATPKTPSSAVMVRLDRSAFSPTTMSDGSLQVISLADPHPCVGSPVKLPALGRLPSPWSPIGKTHDDDVWMSVDGFLVNAAGPVHDILPRSQDDSPALRVAVFSPATVSRISSASLYSSPSTLDALGISVFVNLDDVGQHSQGKNANTTDDPTSVSVPNNARDENLVTQQPQTPRVRRGTLPSTTRPDMLTHSAQPAKRFSTPLTGPDNVEPRHLRSASSISSMAYELRLGLFADEKSMTAIENIISLLDQASPESTPQHDNPMQPMATV